MLSGSYLKCDPGGFKIIRFVASGSSILALLVNFYVFFFVVFVFLSFYKVNHTVSLSVYLGRSARFTVPQCISTFSRWATLLYKAVLSFSSRSTQPHFSPRQFERITTTNNVHIKQYWPLYNRFKHNAVMKNQINHVSLNGWALEPMLLGQAGLNLERGSCEVLDYWCNCKHRDRE